MTAPCSGCRAYIALLREEIRLRRLNEMRLSAVIADLRSPRISPDRERKPVLGLGLAINGIGS